MSATVRTAGPAAARSRSRRFALWASTLVACISLTCSSRVSAPPTPAGANRDAADANALLRQAAALEDNGRLAEALEAGERAVQLAPENFAAWRLLGYLRLNHSDYTGSIAAGETALELAPNDASAHANLSWAFAALGDRDRAEYHAARVEQLAAGSPDALALRAELEQRAGRTDAALELYRAAAQRAPDNPILQVRYAAALRGAGQSLRARDWLQVALARKPAALQLRAALADVLFELADYSGAAAHSEAVLVRAPNTAAALYIAGAAAYRLQNYSAAADRLGQFLKSDETAADARLLYANALLHLERWAEAEAQYRRLLAVRPENPLARFNLAVAILGSGRTEEARAEFSGLCAEGDAAACAYGSAAPETGQRPPVTNPGN